MQTLNICSPIFRSKFNTEIYKTEAEEYTYTNKFACEDDKLGFLILNLKDKTLSMYFIDNPRKFYSFGLDKISMDEK